MSLSALMMINATSCCLSSNIAESPKISLKGTLILLEWTKRNWILPPQLHEEINTSGQIQLHFHNGKIKSTFGHSIFWYHNGWWCYSACLFKNLKSNLHCNLLLPVILSQTNSFYDLIFHPVFQAKDSSSEVSRFLCVRIKKFQTFSPRF